MNLGDLQPIIMGVLAVVSIVASALVGVLTGSMKTLRETVGDRGIRISDLEGQVAREKTERAETASRTAAELAEARSENRVLKSMVTNKVEIVALSDLLDEHHRLATIQWATIDDHVQEIPERLAAVFRDHKDDR